MWKSSNKSVMPPCESESESEQGQRGRSHQPAINQSSLGDLSHQSLMNVSSRNDPRLVTGLWSVDGW